MRNSRIPVDELTREWLQDPESRAASEALDDEFALAAALIEARTRAELTQAEVAGRMGATQAVIARWESGRTKPSTRTLERFARDRNAIAYSFWAARAGAAVAVRVYRLACGTMQGAPECNGPGRR